LNPEPLKRESDALTTSPSEPLWKKNGYLSYKIIVHEHKTWTNSTPLFVYFI
jgi:hypothetical protein